MKFPPTEIDARGKRLATIVLIGLGLSCSPESVVTKATEEKILVIGNGAEPKALDPHLVSSVGDSNIMYALFEGLVNQHPSEDTVGEPGVATAWEPNDDFTVWTFHLRDNAKWSNGDTVTAHDFVYSYQRILTPELASPYSSMLYLLKNAEQYNKGGLTWELANVGVKAVDDFTLECTLKSPTAFFPEVVKHTTFLPVHKATIEKFGTMVDQFTLWQRPGNHIGNGAYKLKSWRINHSVVVEKNPHYWDADSAKIREIRFLPIVSIFTEERMFRDAQMHATYTMPRNLIEWYREQHPEMIRIDGYYASYYYDLNINRPPFDNPKVRLALNLAIDRQKIVDNITLAGERPAIGFTPPTPGGYQPPRLIEFDPERARAALAEAGYPNGEGFPDVAIKFNTLESHKAIAVAIQDMWKKHLNLTQIGLRNEEWKVFQQTRQDRNYDISRDGWTGDFIDPTTFLNLFRTGDSHNHPGYSNPDYDALLDKAANIQNPEQRLAVLYEAEELMLSELPIIPLYWYAKPFLIHPDLRNWNPLLLDHHPYKHLDVVPSGAPFRF